MCPSCSLDHVIADSPRLRRRIFSRSQALPDVNVPAGRLAVPKLLTAIAEGEELPTPEEHVERQLASDAAETVGRLEAEITQAVRQQVGTQ